MRSVAHFTLPLLLATLSCSGSSDAVVEGPSRTVLEGGREIVRYGPLRGGRPTPIRPGLSIGVLEGDDVKTFGDIRGVDADADGTIYIFDTQASEIRAFDGAGEYLRTVASQGEGPGEISEANGFILRDGILWVHDHGQWQLVGLRPEGGEVERHPMHVLSYGYVWTGTVDRAGRLWKEDAVVDEELDRRSRQEGLLEGTYRSLQLALDLSTGAIDSVDLGDRIGRSFIVKMGRGQMHRGIPLDPFPSSAIDPEDGGIWATSGSAYRIDRLNLSGDTTLVLEVDEPPTRVTRRDRDEILAALAESGPPSTPDVDNRLRELLPENKPMITGLSVDDEGRLWVKRTTPEEETARYDVFTRDADFLGSVELDFEAVDYFPIRVRHGQLYTIVRDELFVPSVVRAPLPEWLRGG